MKMTSVKPPQKGGIKSKIICKYFIQGKCIKGESCPYMHSQIEKPKEMTQVECPMYTIGFCKNGPVCHFLHIKKDKYIKEEIEEKIESSPTQKEPEQNIQNNNNNNLNENNNNLNENNNLKNEEKENNNEKNKNYPILPIWYLEHYYDKPISMIFYELEQKKLPEIVELKKKYGFTNIEPNLPIMQPINKKNKTNLNMNTLNLNFNNFNMNLISNNNHTDITNIKNNLVQNSINKTQINQMNQKNNDIKFDAYKFKKDNIEFLINKEENIFYYLIRCKNYDEIKKSLDTNTIILPEELYNQYKDKDIKKNKITVIIFLFDDEYENFAGFAKLKYPITNDQIKEVENQDNMINTYKIEWLWRTKLHYSKVGHLMNRADDDHFLNEGRNGCPIDKDLGNYCCRLMIKRLSKDEVKELINEKKIFENQKHLLENLKKEEYTHDNYKYNDKYKYNNYSDNKYTDKYKYNNYSDNKYNNYSDNKHNKKYSEKSPFKYSNKKNYINDVNINKYNTSKKKEINYTGHKKYRNSSKSRSHNKRSDSEDYYKNKRIKKDDDINSSNYKYDNNKYKIRSNNYHRYNNNDDNKSTDFSSKKSYH